MPGSVTRRPATPAWVEVVRPGEAHWRPDRVVTEEPMEIRLGGPGQEPAAVAVTMRTPGNDFELAVGFLFGEGLLAARDGVSTVRYCAVPAEEQAFNVVSVDLAAPLADPPPQRALAVSAACGVCGSATLDDIEVRCAPIGGGLVVDPEVIVGLPGELRRAQKLFGETGGVHAAGQFTPDGRLVALREDVGRHNAVDKLVGRAFLAGELPMSEAVIMVSGRVSFEIVQKAAVAGAPFVCAVSAPSSLAVSAADRLGVTLVGFVRDGGCNVYSHPERVAGSRPRPV